MVLHPISSAEPAARGTSKMRSAWEAVEWKQKQPAAEWWLIAQPDHAALAGDLAALLDAEFIPRLDEPILRAISLHDSGWARFDGGERGTDRDLEVSLREPRTDNSGKPLSFLEMTPGEFVVAWEDSIDKAAEVSLIGGAMVSEHFCRLAQNRLSSSQDNQQEIELLNEFRSQQSARQAAFMNRANTSREELALLTDILQFCDLLSLYICCGADGQAAFPQNFDDRSISIRRDEGMYRVEPSILGGGASLGVTARQFPSSGAAQVGTLPILIQ